MERNGWAQRQSKEGGRHEAYKTMSDKFKKTVEYIGKLQGIGPRQANRIALAVLNWPKEEIVKFSEAIWHLSEGVSLCQECFNFSDPEPSPSASYGTGDVRCRLCADSKRDQTKICVVEKITDLEAVEKTGLYKGVYHVLGGTINPLESSLPQNLKIKELVARIESKLNGHELEVIIATNPQATGETTALYLEEVLKPLGINPVRGREGPQRASASYGIKITRLAKGLASGSTLEYADTATLHHAFKNRK